MLKNYYFYYSYPIYKDTLFIYFDVSSEAMDEKTIGDISCLYDSYGNLIAYKIKEINKYVKIKSNGFIYSPSKLFIKVINFLLENVGLEILANDLPDKYLIGRVKSITEGICSVSYNNEIYYAKAVGDIKANQLVVIAIEGAILSNSTIFKKTKYNDKEINSFICSEKDLNVSELDTPIQPNYEEENKPFFYTEE